MAPADGGPRQAGAALPPGSAFRLTVPGSTANLGSGFDALGMALGQYDVLDVTVLESGEGTPSEAPIQVEVTGAGAGRVPADERHLVARTLRRTLRELGVRPPGLRLRCCNAIPHARGLGSSAAARIGGVAAGYVLAGYTVDQLRADPRALRLAANEEGHADNAAASLYGGAVVAWQNADGFAARRLEPHPRLSPVALVPAEESSTDRTRGLLPEQVPHADAVFAVGRAALAVYALTTHPESLADALADRLHEEYRAAAWPETVRLVRALRAIDVPAAVSGAGPTVLAFPTDGEMPAEWEAPGFTPLPLAVDRVGVRVRRLN